MIANYKNTINTSEKLCLINAALIQISGYLIHLLLFSIHKQNLQIATRFVKREKKLNVNTGSLI